MWRGGEEGTRAGRRAAMAAAAQQLLRMGAVCALRARARGSACRLMGADRGMTGECPAMEEAMAMQKKNAGGRAAPAPRGREWSMRWSMRPRVRPGRVWCGERLNTAAASERRVGPTMLWISSLLYK